MGGRPAWVSRAAWVGQPASVRRAAWVSRAAWAARPAWAGRPVPRTPAGPLRAGPGRELRDRGRVVLAELPRGLRHVRGPLVVVPVDRGGRVRRGHPRHRHALLAGVRHDRGGAAAAPGRLAVPQRDEHVGAVHHVAAGPLVGLVAAVPRPGHPDRGGPPEQLGELGLRGVRGEVGQVVPGRQRQHGLQRGVRPGQHLGRDQPVGPLGQRGDDQQGRLGAGAQEPLDDPRDQRPGWPGPARPGRLSWRCPVTPIRNENGSCPSPSGGHPAPATPVPATRPAAGGSSGAPQLGRRGRRRCSGASPPASGRAPTWCRRP